MHYQLQWKQISDSQAFRSTQKVMLFLVIIFCCIMPN